MLVRWGRSLRGREYLEQCFPKFGHAPTAGVSAGNLLKVCPVQRAGFQQALSRIPFQLVCESLPRSPKDAGAADVKSLKEEVTQELESQRSESSQKGQEEPSRNSRCCCTRPQDLQHAYFLKGFRTNSKEMIFTPRYSLRFGRQFKCLLAAALSNKL